MYLYMNSNQHVSAISMNNSFTDFRRKILFPYFLLHLLYFPRYYNSDVNDKIIKTLAKHQLDFSCNRKIDKKNHRNVGK